MGSMIVQVSFLLISSLLCNSNYASGFVGNLLLQSSSSSSIRQYENGMIINRCSYGSVSGRVASCYKLPPPLFTYTALTALFSSPLDDFLDNIFGNNNNNNENQKDDNIKSNKANNTNDVEETMSISSFQQELAKRQKNEVESDTVDSSASSTNSNSNTKGSEKEEEQNEDEFDGYALRDAIYIKYGECFDVDFQRVDVGGFRNVYLVSAFVVEIRNKEVLRDTHIWGGGQSLSLIPPVKYLHILVYSHIIVHFENLVLRISCRFG